MAEEHELPLLNPVLSLQMEPALESRTGGGKGRHSIAHGRLDEQKDKLGDQVQALHASRAEFVTFGGKTLLTVRMFPDSLAPSHTPTDLFAPVHGCRFVAPLHKGYLIEADLGQFGSIAAEIRNPRGYAVQADISRVSDIEIFDEEARLRGRSLNDLWEAAPESEGGRLFVVWLTPFRDRQAREALFEKITGLSNDRTLLPVFSRGLLPVPGDEATRETRPAVVPRQANIARAMRSYRNTGVGYATVRVSDKGSLAVLVASGASSRIDPVRRLASTSPGEGPHPAPPIQLGNVPIIAVIDGGLHASTYQPAEAWRVPPLVPDNEADRQHGNGVSSLAVHAHAWNNKRNLPALECRIGTVQAVPHKNSAHPFDDQELIDYLDNIARTRPGGMYGTYPPTKAVPGWITKSSASSETA